ncbi:MAG: DoxX family membrane protein [Vicinamibacteria bacterium]
MALIGLGIEHFLFRDFVVGRAPAWPESVPGGVIWAYLTGITLVVIGPTMLFGKKARSAAILAAVLIVLWALLRHIPVVAADSFLSGAWTRAGKALVFAGGALAIAATFPKTEALRNSTLSKVINRGSEFILLGRLCLGLFLVITGIQHFLFTEFVASLIPKWFPGNAVLWTYFAGLALIAGGIGLFIPQTARLAALLSGWMVFSWFWIVHIPRTFVGVSDSIAVFEALAVSGVTFVLAGYLSQGKNRGGRERSPETIAHIQGR